MKILLLLSLSQLSILRSSTVLKSQCSIVKLKVGVGGGRGGTSIKRWQLIQTP